MASVAAMHPADAVYEPVGVHARAIRPSDAGPGLGGSVEATLNFYTQPTGGEVPYYYVEEPPDGQPRRNFGDGPKSILIRDIRDNESHFELDRHAFAAIKNRPDNRNVDWSSEDSIKEHYYPEVERLLADSLSGSALRVLIFDHTIRRAIPGANRAPVNRVHIDQTDLSARSRVMLHLTEEESASVLSTHTRYRIVNVWRPLNGAVESFPLAFANSETVHNDDMVAVEHRYPTRTGETAAVKNNPSHEWYYWSSMANDERLLLQCYDSDSPNNRVPHSAFSDPRSTAQSKPRESIEVRALVFG